MKTNFKDVLKAIKSGNPWEALEIAMNFKAELQRLKELGLLVVSIQEALGE